MRNRCFLLVLFGLAFVVNPNLACSESRESDFTYAEAEMKQAVLGSWQGSAELDGESAPFSLTLEQGSSRSKTQGLTAPGLRPQCGSRSFVKPAGACVSETTMPVSATLSSESPLLNGAAVGTVIAYRTLDVIELELELDSGAVLSGRIEGDSLSEGLLKGAGPSSSFSLARP